MTHTTDLLDAFKKTRGLRNDLAAASELGITRGAVSAWRTEKRHAEPESVETMAKACGLDPEEWVLRVQADREAQVNPRRAQVWVRCADRLAKAALAACVVASFGLLNVQTVHAQGVDLSSHNPANTVYYVKSWMRRLRKAAVTLFACLLQGMQHGPTPAAT